MWIRALLAVQALGALAYALDPTSLWPIGVAFAISSLACAAWAAHAPREGVADELARRVGQQAAVADLGRRAIASGEVDELMQRAAEVAAWILDSERAYVLELEAGTDELLVRAASGAAAALAPGDSAGAGLGGLARAAVRVEGRAFAALPAERPEPWAADLAGEGVDTALVAPVGRRDGPWGVIAVLGERDAFGEDDVSFLQAVANVLGAVLTRAREEELESQLSQSQRLESVGQLAGGVAHDFNNILAVILNYADFAREAAVDPGQRSDLAELSKAAQRGAALVKQLLLFSRRRPVDALPLDVTEVVRDTEPLLSRTIGEHIELRCELASHLPLVQIDSGQLAQVLVNLAVNARDAMSAGGVLTISTAPCATGVLIAVEDSGYGMPAEVARKAFDPFFTTKPPGSGSGLGLATVYGTITQAGGAVSIDSVPARGTQVTIELPATRLPAQSTAGLEGPLPGAGRGETILVVEDDQQVRGVAGRILAAHGYAVIEAEGGEDALAVVAAGEHVDLLLADVVMPGMSGVELAERLRRTQPELPVLHMSGYANGNSGRDLSLELPELLEKPFSATDLLVRVRALLEGARAGTEAIRGLTPPAPADVWPAPSAHAHLSADSPAGLLS